MVLKKNTLILILILLILLCGCVDDSKVSPSAATTPTTTAEPTTEIPTKAPTQAPTVEPTAEIPTEEPTEDPLQTPYIDHLYLSYKNKGFCQNLSGDVAITFIFIDDAESAWEDDSIEKEKLFLEKELEILKNDAKEYNITLNVHAEYLHSEIDCIAGEVKPNAEWFVKACEALGVSPANDINMVFAQKYNVAEAPIMFVLNKEGRAFASSGKNEKWPEYAVIYSQENALRHELYHLYGALDLYLPEITCEAAEKYLPDSIMSGGSVTDALTAYIIGWTDILTESAKNFLAETSNVDEFHQI